MTFKEQLNKLKENWLFAVVFIILFGLILFGNNSGSNFMQKAMYSEDAMMSYDGGMGISSSRSSNNFASEVEERKVIQNANLRTEVERNTYYANEDKLKNIVKASESFILNENVNKYGEEKKSYISGYYSIKVNTEKYDSVVSQLKEIGKIQSFSESKTDVTGTYTDTEINLELEEDKLARYKEMLEESKEISDKIELTDRIFTQERTIKYMKKSIENIDEKIEYTTISFSMQEKRSNYANIAMVKFSELVRKLVNSINKLFSLFFVVLPWALLALVIWIIYRFVRK